MKHSIDYYIEHIEPMIDNLNRQQEIQIDNTKFLVLKVRTKGVTYILIASQYNWNGVHYWVYNTNTKQVENIIHSTYHFMMVQQGLQEYEGHVYMCQVKITAIEILN